MVDLLPRSRSYKMNTAQIITLHHCAGQFLSGVCADMLCLVFSQHGAVHCGQTLHFCFVCLKHIVLQILWGFFFFKSSIANQSVGSSNSFLKKELL